MDSGQQFQIPQDEIGFRQDREAEPIAADDLQAAAGQLELGFERQIRVGHRAGGDHAGTPLSAQFGLKQDRGVGFDLDILEIMQHLVTAAAAVAVDTAVGASAVEVHPFCGERMDLYAF